MDTMGLATCDSLMLVLFGAYRILFAPAAHDIWPSYADIDLFSAES